MQWERSDLKVRVGLGDVLRAWGVSLVFLLLGAWAVKLWASPGFLSVWIVPVLVMLGILSLRFPQRGNGSAKAIALRRVLGRGTVGFMLLPLYVPCVVEAGDGELVVWLLDGRVGRIKLGEKDSVEVYRRLVRKRLQKEVRSTLCVGKSLLVEILDEGAVTEHLIGMPGVEWKGEQKWRVWPSWMLVD